MHDPRLDTLADLLIQHSTRLEIGEKILIETFDIPEDPDEEDEASEIDHNPNTTGGAPRSNEAEAQYIAGVMDLSTDLSYDTSSDGDSSYDSSLEERRNIE